MLPHRSSDDGNLIDDKISSPHLPIVPNINNLLNNPINTTSSSLPLSNISFSSSPSPPPTSNSNLIQSPTNNTSTTVPTLKKKQRRKSSTNEEKFLLSTSSPEGIATANEITPNRIANILLNEGPLPIRHLTGHLIKQVPLFGNLSLSKQRRLIMSSLESGDIENNCIFEKIGWGQWEAKVVDKEIVEAKIKSAALNSNANTNTNANNNNSNIEHNVDNITTSNTNTINDNVSRPISSSSQTSYYDHNKISASSLRRESISNAILDHQIKMPISPTLAPIQDFRNSLKTYGNVNEAIDSSTSGDDFDDLDDIDDNINNVNSHNNNNNNIQFYNRMTNRSSSFSTNKMPNIRSPSVSSSHRPSFAGIVKPRKPRSSFTQHSLEVQLDDAPLERRESRVSFSNSANLSRQSFLRTNISPHFSNNNSSISFHDKDNENVIIDDDDDDENDENENENHDSSNDQHNIHDNDTLTSLKNYKYSNTNNSDINYINNNDDGSNFTDEEDWKSVGATFLKNNRQSSIVTPPTPMDSGKSPEELAAIALMDLKTV